MVAVVITGGSSTVIFLIEIGHYRSRRGENVRGALVRSIYDSWVRNLDESDVCCCVAGAVAAMWVSVMYRVGNRGSHDDVPSVPSQCYSTVQYSRLVVSRSNGPQADGCPCVLYK